jgi:hypothetical protein
MYVAPLADSTAFSGVTIRQFSDDSQACKRFVLRPDFLAQVECCSELANWAMRTDAWLTSNRVQLNISKSTFLYASTRHQTLIEPAAPLQVGLNLVYPSQKANNLGVVIESSLSMSTQIRQIVEK